MIESKDNQLVKHINKLKHKKDRKIYKQYIVEGKKSVDEALRFDKGNIVEIIVSEAYAKTSNIEENYIIFNDEVFNYVTEHQTPEGIMAILKMKEEQTQIDYKEPYIILINEIQDPGNLGNIIRIADSLNLKQIILSENTVDPYMPKVVRSTMGSTFRINTFERNIINIIEELKQNGYEIYSTNIETNSENLYLTKFKGKKTAIIFGNEAKGVAQEILNETKSLYIPMKGQSDSLNVASAVAVISYEIYRQNL